MKKLLLIFCYLLFVYSVHSQTVLSKWTFESPVAITGIGNSPTITPATADGGVLTAGSVASALHASAAATWSSPAGNGSVYSLSSNNWQVGDYYQFQFSTLNYNTISIVWDATGSGTGPNNFKVQYSTDGSNFTDASGNNSIYAFPNPVIAWATASAKTVSTLTLDLSGVSSLNNAAAVYIRLTNTSTTSNLGATVATGGTSRVDNFTVTGTIAGSITNFYSKSSGNLDVVSTWGTNSDGSGNSPSDFISNAQIFNIKNNSTPTITAAWTVGGTGSKVVIGDGATACKFTVPASFTLTSGTLNIAAGGSLVIGSAGTVNFNSLPVTILSSSFGTGSIIGNATLNGGISGATAVTIQRYIGNNLQWRMVGFPFTTATTISKTALAAFYTSGFTAYNFNEPGDNGAYNGNGGINAGWTPFVAGTITADKGLLINGGTVSSTINFTGPINTGTQNIALGFSSSNTNKGWNLIANPFASNIDWTTIQSNNIANLDNAIYRYDPNTTAYASYVNGTNSGNQSNVIENGAGFFVHSSGAINLTIRESDKTINAPIASLFGLPGAQQDKSIIKITLLKEGETYGDEVVLRWGVDPATDGFDARYDAHDLGRAEGSDLSVTGNDGMVYSIFHGSPLQTKGKEQRVIALGIKNITEGNHSFNTSLLSAMYDGNEVYLIDHYTNQTKLISSTTASYPFMVTSDVNSASASRFSIALNYKAVDNTINTNMPVILLNNPSTGNLFTIYSKNNYNKLQWQIVDGAGRLLQTGAFGNVLKGTTYQINGGIAARGNFFIQLNGDGNSLPVLKALKN